MAITTQKLQKQFSLRNVFLPVLLGLGVVGYMLYQNDEPGQWQALPQASTFWLSMALLVLLIRDFGYMYRIRYITDKVLTWKQSFNVLMLWEFASCALPSVVGGSTIAAYILFKEKIPLGKSLVQVMLTAMLDKIYFALAVPLVMLFARDQLLPELVGLNEAVRQSIGIAFFISYLMVALYAGTMFYALLLNPKGMKRLLIWLGQQKPFRRWREQLFRHANELLLSAKHLRSKSGTYWLHAGLSTFFVWTARYLIIGCLIAAFAQLSAQDHLIVFARNLIYKIVLFVPVMPGGAGFAEISFPAFFDVFVGGFTTMLYFFTASLPITCTCS